VHSLTGVTRKERWTKRSFVVRRSPFVVHRKVLQGGFHPLYMPYTVR